MLSLKSGQLERQIERSLDLNCIKNDSADKISISDNDSSLKQTKRSYVDRGSWKGKLDFILSCIGYAVGLGNVWRFPYICNKHGGGAFLVPYFLFLIICGMPMFILELCFGQFASLSPLTAFHISPIFQGLGYGMLLISTVVCVYYNIIIMWTIYYIYLSFNSVLPWSTCGNSWNTPACTNGNHLPATSLIGVNATSDFSLITNVTKLVPSSEEFWDYAVLDVSEGIEAIGNVRLPLFITLIVAWALVFCCVFKGVESTGRVVYFSATFPYVVLSILLIRGLTLEGAAEGVMYFLTPRWSKLKDFEVWAAAASQIFYSVGAAWGSVLTMASYNKFHHSCYRDAIIVPIVNCFTSMLTGMVVFSIIGFMAYETNQPIDLVIKEGPGLVFNAYPEAVTRMPLAPVWSVLFFIMILMIGVDSQFAMLECVISSIVDRWPSLRKWKLKFTLSVCVVLFLCGIPMTTNGGIYILTLLDDYSSTWTLMIICFLECILIAWVYGDERFSLDIELMIGKKPHVWFRFCWRYITPLTILFIFGFSLLTYEGSKLDQYEFPPWANVVGLGISSISAIAIPICAIHTVYNAKGSFKERMVEALRPSPKWGPSRQEHRKLYRESILRVPAKFPQLYVEGIDNFSHPMTGIENKSASVISVDV